MFRIHEHLGHKLLAVRMRGVQVKFYQPSLFKWTRCFYHNKYVPSMKMLGYTKNEDYNDWVAFDEIPKHIPEYQWFMYYVAKWEKHKDEVPE